MSESAHILVVDDDARLRELLSRYLAEQGFRITIAESAEKAREKLGFVSPDLVVLDVMMPGESGLSLAEFLHRERDQRVPVLLLSARGAPDDRVAGFEAGADDYLPKPFDPRELLLRIRALLRRTAQAELVAGPVPLGRAVFDVERAELTTEAGTVYLTGGEAALLSALARKPNEVLSREEIAAALGMEDASERAIDVQVTRLRRKIEIEPREPRFLHTVRGRGYVLKPGT